MLPAFRQSRTKCRSSAKLSFFSFPGTFCRMFAAASHIILYVNAGKEGQAGRQSYLATAHDKSAGRRPAFSFTRGKGFGAKKKLVARILKSEPLILKFKPLIFRPLKPVQLMPVTNGPSGTIPFAYIPSKTRPK